MLKIYQIPDTFSEIKQHHAYFVYFVSGLVINYVELLLLFAHMKKTVWIGFLFYLKYLVFLSEKWSLFMGVASVIDMIWKKSV